MTDGDAPLMTTANISTNSETAHSQMEITDGPFVSYINPSEGERIYLAAGRSIVGVYVRYSWDDPDPLPGTHHWLMKCYLDGQRQLDDDCFTDPWTFGVRGIGSHTIRHDLYAVTASGQETHRASDEVNFFVYGPLTAYFGGPGELDPGTAGTWHSFVEPGTPPYSYQWSWKEECTNYSAAVGSAVGASGDLLDQPRENLATYCGVWNFGGTGPSFTQTLFRDATIKLVVTDAAGKTASHSSYVFVNGIGY